MCLSDLVFQNSGSNQTSNFKLPEYQCEDDLKFDVIWPARRRDTQIKFMMIEF